MADYVKVARVSDIPEGSMRGFEIGPHHIVICHAADGFHALADECSHDAAPISSGELQGREIVCPRHGARFSIIDGSVTAPPAVVGIDRFKHKIEGEDIFVLLD
ncbi:MAG: Rieske 2Fe-2S domain-containing protein [bacterium]